MLYKGIFEYVFTKWQRADYRHFPGISSVPCLHARTSNACDHSFGRLLTLLRPPVVKTEDSKLGVLETFVLPNKGWRKSVIYWHSCCWSHVLAINFSIRLIRISNLSNWKSEIIYYRYATSTYINNIHFLLTYFALYGDSKTTRNTSSNHVPNPAKWTAGIMITAGLKKIIGR